MPIDTTNALRPGDIPSGLVGIYREIGPRGGKTKHYIAQPSLRKMPKTKRAGNLWKPIKIFH